MTRVGPHTAYKHENTHIGQFSQRVEKIGLWHRGDVCDCVCVVCGVCLCERSVCVSTSALAYTRRPRPRRGIVRCWPTISSLTPVPSLLLFFFFRSFSPSLTQSLSSCSPLIAPSHTLSPSDSLAFYFSFDFYLCLFQSFLLFISIYLSIYLSIHPFIHPSVIHPLLSLHLFLLHLCVFCPCPWCSLCCSP